MNHARIISRLRLQTAFTPLTTPATSLRPRLPTPSKPQLQFRQFSTRRISLPRILSPSFWATLIPKAFRNAPSSSPSAPKSREWNPASYYIIIFILIGSQAIRMIMLKNEYNGYLRSTDAKIRLLREVIEKVKRGEDVDVRKLLGTGDVGVEREWDEVLREIEREDSIWHQKQKQKHEAEEKAKAEEQQRQHATKSTSTPTTDESTTIETKPRRKPGFF
ncbi:DUF5321 domain-containing protein [Aspergillus stella-maris]|uniref:DUF5321 domain-containing protein n=1 Tax=Aspergillus stella-maris TaxID=1810926 RepID=UPI003CCDCC9C